MIKTLLSNRYLQLGVMFVAGGAVAALLLPTKTTIKREVEIQVVEKVVEKKVVEVVYKDRVSETDTKDKTRTVTHRVIASDGTITEDVLSETESQTVARVVEQERQRYESLLKEMEQSFNKKESYLKEVLNPKRFHLFAGAGLDPSNLLSPKVTYIGGISGTLWGPVTIGGFATSETTIGLTLGLSF